MATSGLTRMTRRRCAASWSEVRRVRSAGTGSRSFGWRRTASTTIRTGSGCTACSRSGRGCSFRPSGCTLFQFRATFLGGGCCGHRSVFSTWAVSTISAVWPAGSSTARPTRTTSSRRGMSTSWTRLLAWNGGPGGRRRPRSRCRSIGVRRAARVVRRSRQSSSPRTTSRRSSVHCARWWISSSMLHLR